VAGTAATIPTAERISAAQARRIALAAQGFAQPRPTGRVDRRHFRRALDRMGLIQIDSVNVLVRSQELPLFARLGPHPRTLIAEATAAREMFEYWVHEASHVSMEHYHLHRWRMEQHHKWQGVRSLEAKRPGFIDQVYDHVATNGPIASGDLAERVGPKGFLVDWDDGKIALEHLFWAGRVTAWRRPNDFARLYDLTERIIPADVLARPAPDEHEARKELLVLAARHHGIGTFEDLTDYHRQKNPPCRPLLPELIEEGRLVPIQVEGWRQLAYMHPDAHVPRRISAASLLSPFDPVVWRRERTERLFGFHYRIEIYVPQPKRQYGYYVLPFLMGDQLVARVDLKSDRQAGVLRALGVFGEHGVPASRCRVRSLASCTRCARGSGLDRVEVGERGDLASPLRDAVHHYAHA
jgi:uncharacterized protein YcaQ